MSVIRILPAEVANRIAAGEVIERPASVVKELVENAIDAGASRIRIQTAHGGQRLIQVTDDGCGMDRDDALLCVEAHATSKIAEAADVGQIRTLGFRGEALPSISAVSRFTLQTRPHDDDIGTEILIEAGALRDVRDCGCAPGTHISVTHLFANMPARRKFMRGPSTEDGHIQDVVLLQALAHPEISFELVANGREALRASQAADLRARIGMLMGRETLEAMLPVGYEESGVCIHGFVAKPGFTRSSRREQRIFVNGRPATAEVVHYGIREAYETLVMKGRYPPVVLYLELAHDRVDVNVHPAKREVRFREARFVGQVVAAAVRDALRKMAGDPVLRGSPALQSQAPRPAAPAPQPFALESMPSQPHLPVGSDSAAKTTTNSPAPETRLPAETESRTADDTGQPTPPSPAPPGNAPPPVVGTAPVPAPSAQRARDDIGTLQILGVFRKRYLVGAGPRGLVLIDQQAAHQRVLFENLLAAGRDRNAPQQQLLIPATVDLGADDAKLLQAELEHFQRIGFGIDHFGGNTFLITGVPANFPREDVAGILRDILDDLREGTGRTPRPDRVRIARAACMHAVTANDTLSEKEVRQLINDLAAADMPYTDPDGRPVMVNIPVSEIDKRFGRNS